MMINKRVYISADYSPTDGDREVIDILHKWGKDCLHSINYVDTASVVSGSVSDDSDCRACDLKAEFNLQINAASYVIFIIGDKTAIRTAGSGCRRYKNERYSCKCTPYKQNTNGIKDCKVFITRTTYNDIGNINSYSYLEHEWYQAIKKKKRIIIFYNSLNKQPSWLPSYMSEYEKDAFPFWVKNDLGYKVGNYKYLKVVLES